MKKLSLFLASVLLGVCVFGSLDHSQTSDQKRHVLTKKESCPPQLLDGQWRVPRGRRLDRSRSNSISNNDLWAWVFGDIYLDYFESLTATDDGGCAFMITTFFQNIWLGRISSEGDILLQKQHSASGPEYGSNTNPIIQTKDKGLAFVITSYAGVDRDIYFVKTSPELDAVMAKYLFGKTWPVGEAPEGKKKDDYGYAVGEAENEDIFVLGVTHYYSDPGDVVVFKISPSENRIVWQKVLITDGGDYPAGVTPLKNGGCYVYGGSSSFNPSSDAWVVKFSPEGKCDWQRAFGGNGSDAVYSAVLREDEGLTLAGTTSSYGAGGADFWVFDVSPDGDLMPGRQIALGGSKSDIARSIDKAMNGDIILGGGTESSGNGNQDCLVIRVSPAFNVKWAKTYGGKKGEHAKSVQEALDGNLYVAGPTTSFGYTEWRFEYKLELDALVLKLSSNGETNVPDLSHNMNIVVTPTSAIAYDTWATVMDNDIVLRDVLGGLSDFNPPAPLPVNVSAVYPPVDVKVEINEDKTLFKAVTYFKLRWEKNPLSKNIDVVEYRIYKKSLDENTYTYLDKVLSEAVLPSSNEFIYEGSLQESAKGVVYAVTAFDSSGQESGFSVSDDLTKGK